MQDSKISARLAEFAPSERNCLCMPSSSPHSLRIATGPVLVARSLGSLTVRAVSASPGWIGDAAPTDHPVAQSAAVLADRPTDRSGSSR